MAMNHVRRAGSILTTCVTLAAAAAGLRAADWPQWRGPNRDGVSQETGLLKEWPKEGPKLLWQVNDAGAGYSTPAVVGDRLYLLGNKGMEDEFVQARAVADGKVAWTTRVGNVGNPKQKPAYPAARSTPTVDGDLLYAIGSDGDLACLETAGGKVRWQKNLRTDFGGKPGIWAYSESPLVDAGRLICTPGGSDATLVALDKKSGDVVWKSVVPGGDEAGYASVVAVDAAGGGRQYVQFLQKGVVGVDAATGKFLWRFDKTAQNSPANIPTPVVKAGAAAGELLVYTGTGLGGGGLARAKGGETAAESVYFDRKLPTAIGGSVLVGDHLYGTSSAGLICVEFATGKVKWQDRSIGAAAVCYAEGRLYLHGENGEAALVDAAPDAYHERGRFAPPNQPDRGQSKAWAYPVVANGRLYVRDAGAVWCYDVKAP